MYLGHPFSSYPVETNESLIHEQAEGIQSRVPGREGGGLIVIALVYRIAGRKDKGLGRTGKIGFNGVYCVVSVLV